MPKPIVRAPLPLPTVPDHVQEVLDPDYDIVHINAIFLAIKDRVIAADTRMKSGRNVNGLGAELDWYAVLDIPYTAEFVDDDHEDPTPSQWSLKTIKQIYRLHLLCCHPDKQRSDSDRLSAQTVTDLVIQANKLAMAWCDDQKKKALRNTHYGAPTTTFQTSQRFWKMNEREAAAAAPRNYYPGKAAYFQSTFRPEPCSGPPPWSATQPPPPPYEPDSTAAPNHGTNWRAPPLQRAPEHFVVDPPPPAAAAPRNYYPGKAAYFQSTFRPEPCSGPPQWSATQPPPPPYEPDSTAAPNHGTNWRAPPQRTT